MNPYTLTCDQAGSAVLELRGELTIEHVRDLHAVLCDGGKAPRSIRVDCSAVTRLDAAAVQLLFAAARAAESAEISGRGDPWSSAFARYGMRDPFIEMSQP